MKKAFLPTLLFLFGILCISPSEAQIIKVQYTPKASDASFSGNVYLYLSKENKNPRDGGVGIERFPCFRIAVKNIKPNQSITFDDQAVAYPEPLSGIERGTYYIQAVWDRNLGGRSIAYSPGNMFNEEQKITLTQDHKAVYTITCTQVNPSPTFEETNEVKEMKVSSKLLSTFYKRPTTINAAVILPEGYSKSSRKYPVLYRVSGYGGDYHRFSGSTKSSNPIDTTQCITVFLDGNCPLGHSVYANSANNGPWGDALTQELIPAVEKRFRCNGARLLMGHSSGGWTVLWLQTQYPKVFAACWSSSPDPVDFRSFQKVNLYQDQSMYFFPYSSRHWVATVAGAIPWASQEQAYQMENVIDRGEQMHSFDAVFSQKMADGSPGRICDAKTGALNPKVFEHWKQYDISRYLRNNWEDIKDNLAGKIRVSVGEQDNFLLNDAVHMLDKEMQKIHADVHIAYYPGDHFTVFSNAYRKDGNDFLEQAYIQFLNKK